MENKDSSTAYDTGLTNVISRLSIAERNSIQEDVHGVHCVCPEETPEIIKEGLSKLAHILDTNETIPDTKKRGYIRSKEINEKRDKPTYIFTDEFRLLFLRGQLFNAERAAIVLLKFLDTIEIVFGRYALERPVNIDDFKKNELMMLRKGATQLLPYRDHTGRRIIITFPEAHREKRNSSFRNKVALYMAFRCAMDDIETQRKGIVLIRWFSEDFLNEEHAAPEGAHHYSACCPVRTACIHVCMPKAPATPPNCSVLATSNFQLRFRTHIGNPVELLYQLQTYGIPTKTLPVTWSGTIKTSYFKQWMWIRQYIEDGFSIVECPGTHDVIFRQGTSILSHPGNVQFINLIESKFVSYIKGNNSTAIESKPKLVASIVKELLQDLHERKGRVLTWFDNKGYGCVGWWSELDDPDQKYSKIEYLVTKEMKKIAFDDGRKKRRDVVDTRDRSEQKRQRSTSAPSPAPPAAPARLAGAPRVVFSRDDLLKAPIGSLDDARTTMLLMRPPEEKER